VRAAKVAEAPAVRIATARRAPTRNCFFIERLLVRGEVVRIVGPACHGAMRRS
jgi:hypothetical protein